MDHARSTIIPARLISAIAHFDVHATELYRIFVMKGILAPAAYVLPESWGLHLAKLLVLPLKRLFGGGRYRSFRMAWSWIADPFLDFFVFQRVLNGRDDVTKWKIVQRNAEGVARLREAGQSFIIATGHFQRTAHLAVVSPDVTHGTFIQSTLTAPQRAVRPLDYRMQIQFGTMLKVITFASSKWKRPFELVYTNAGSSAARQLLDRLGKPGSVVSISVDAPWPRGVSGSFSRPFAGMRERSFSTGAARLAKLCKCPIVTCVCWREDDGTVVFEWGTPIMSVGNEIDTMNHLIDVVEKAVGERPIHYVLDLGQERQWDPHLRRWQ
jgi:lauroyl/myristoyl acyltransferase